MSAGTGAAGRRIGAVLSALVAFVIIFILSTTSGSAAPSLGAGAVDLPAGHTVATVIADLAPGGYDATGWESVALSNGSYVSTADAFTASATGTVAGSGLEFDVLIHTELDVAGLTVAIQVRKPGEDVGLGDIAPLLDGTAAADLGAPWAGISTHQGTGSSADFDTFPTAEAQAFLAETTGASVDAASGLHLAMAATPGTQWSSMTEIIGTEGITSLDVRGTITADWPNLSTQWSPGAASLDALDPLALTYTTAATAAAWSPGSGFSISLNAAASDWTFTTNYNQADQRVQTLADGPSWTVTVPIVAPSGIDLTPNGLFAEGVGTNPSPLEVGVGGALGTWTVPGTSLGLDLSANFRRQADTFIADFYGELAAPGASPTLSFDIYPTVVEDEWSLTLTGTADELTLASLADLFDVTIDPAVPASFRTVGLRDTTVVGEFAESNPGGFQLGVTSTLSASPFAGTAVGVSVMALADVGTGPTELMVGVAPSVQPIGGRGGADPLEDIWLSDIVPAAAGPSDFVIFDADDPTTGLGVIWSSKTSRIGGEPCLVDPGADDCPDDKAAQYVPVNVAQWLMPLFGFDGSDAALADSTEAAGQCQICSFRKDDFQPATPFTVTGGLSVAGSLVLPAPLGSDFAALDSACAPDPTSDGCTRALGVLGAIGLDSRVTVGGTLPLGGEDQTGLGLRLGLGLLNHPAIERPTWLHDAGLSLAVSNDPATGFSLTLDGELQVAIKQGFAEAEAEALFGAGSTAAATNTLAPVAAGAACPRGGIAKVEPNTDAGFAAGSSYCHDLLQLSATGRIDAGPTGTSVSFVGDMLSVIPDGEAYAPNPDGWSPLGFDRISINQTTVTLGIETKPAGGTSVALGGAFSATINTADPVPFSAALQLSVRPNVIVLDGMRLNVGQLSIDNLVEIYEWISGEAVPGGDLPGVSVRNVSFGIGTDRIQALCIEQGFRLTGDLYVADELAPAGLPPFTCDADPNSPTFGELSPAPAAPCDQAAIDAGCRAGIRLVVNELGMTGDAFMAAFDAGPVHVYQPANGAVIPPDQAGRGVSITLEINATGISAHIFGGAALGGTAAPASCNAGPYCDAWAAGEFNALLTAGVNGANLKLYGMVQSRLPGLPFRMLAAGESTVPGVNDMLGLFERGEIPDAGFRLHVEMANADVAPELDFAAQFQSDLNDDLAEISDGLRDLREIVTAIKNNQTSKARRLLREYDADSDIEALIDVISEIRSGAAEAERSATLSFLLNGEYFGLPGIVTRNADDERVCAWPQWGFGSRGTRTSSTSSYSRGFCFSVKPFYVSGACDVLLDRRSCTVDDLADEIIIDPILESIIASIDVAIDSVELAKNASEFVLSGQLFTVECASFDWTRGTFDTLGGGAQESVDFGLFVTLFGQDIGTSFGWSFDTATPPDQQLRRNFDRLGKALIDLGSNNTPTTCWSAAELARFFGNEIVPPGAEPPPAELRSIVVDDPGIAGTNISREGAAATVTATWDAPLAAERTVSFTWGDGTTGSLTAPAGATTATTTKTWVDDGPAAAGTESVEVDARDTTTGRTIATAVTLLNVDPSVVLSTSPVEIDENDTATLTLTVQDPGAIDTHELLIDWGDGSTETVAMTPASRTVTRSHQWLQNPIDEIATITVDVIDKDGGAGEATIDLIVNNVAPVVTVFTPPQVDEGLTVDYTVEWSDPGTRDGHELAIRWDDRAPGLDPLGRPLVDEVWTVIGGQVLIDLPHDGLREDDADQTPDLVRAVEGAGPVRSLTISHRYADDDPTATPFDVYDVRIDIVDIPDADATSATFGVTVDDVAPVAVVHRDEQTVQYSDEIATIAVTATDVEADELRAVAVVSSPIDAPMTLPAGGLTLSDPTCQSIADERQLCEWLVDGIVDLGAGTWTVEITVHDDDTLVDVVRSTLVVLPEDAVVAFPSTNPVDVQVPADDEPSGPFTLRTEVTELVPDQAPYGPHPGDVERALVEMTLEPVAPGLASHSVACVQESVDPVSSGYDQRLVVTCDFDAIPVGTYWARTDVHGRFWTGTGETVVTVSDPSLGHATAGGRFDWGVPGAVRFNLSADYVGRTQPRPTGHLRLNSVRGSGATIEIDSTAITSMAIGSFEGTDWVTVTASADVHLPGAPVDGWTVVLYAEDNGNGSRIDDVWVELRAPGAVEADPWSFARPAGTEAERMTHGSLQIH